jgi:hypothetical protein
LHLDQFDLQQVLLVQQIALLSGQGALEGRQHFQAKQLWVNEMPVANLDDPAGGSACSQCHIHGGHERQAAQQVGGWRAGIVDLARNGGSVALDGFLGGGLLLTDALLEFGNPVSGMLDEIAGDRRVFRLILGPAHHRTGVHHPPHHAGANSNQDSEATDELDGLPGHSLPSQRPQDLGLTASFLPRFGLATSTHAFVALPQEEASLSRKLRTRPLLATPVAVGGEW